MAELSRHQQNNESILLVEPDPENRAQLEKMFHEAGWRVTPSDGDDHFSPNDDDQPSIILTSTGREGFNAIDFIRRVRLNDGTKNTPIVMLADPLSDSLSAAALREGANDITTAPFTKERLVPRVKAHICLAHLRKEDQEYVPRAFEQLRLSERRYRLLVSATAAVVWTASPEGEVTEEMQTWEQFTGQSRAEYSGFGWLSAVHAEDKETVEQLWKGHARNQAYPVETSFRLKRNDGQYRQMHLKAIPVRDGKSHFREWIGMVTDITEQRESEEALRTSEERLRLILESSTDFAIFTTDNEGNVTTWNAGAQQLLGYEDDEICHTNFRRIFTPEDVEAGAPDVEMKSARESGRGADQRWHVRKDGSRFWADGLLMPLRDEEGNNCGYLKIIRDFTEQKKAQDELRALADQLEDRVEARTGELEDSRARLRSLIFELNRAEQMERQRIAAELHDKPAQLLTAARLSLEAAAREAGDVKPALKKVDHIISEATRATRSLMTDLSGPRVLEHDDLLVMLHWAIDKMREEGLSVELTSNEPNIPLDRDLLTLLFQTVRELLLNVLKHAGTAEAYVNVHKTDKQMEIEVVDHGSGFDPLKKVNQPGPTGGFGLLNIQERLRWLGGKLDLNSAPGSGTRAKIILPLKAEAIITDEEPVTATLERRQKREPSETDKIAVLLVDDHRIVREGFRSLIEGRPDICVVGEAGDGIEAIENARDLQPDIVVMDINMPRMNGLEATRHLVEEMPDVTVIGLSLHGHDDMADSIKKAGAVAYVSKEEACDTLCEVIRKEYHKRHPEPVPNE